MAKVKTVSWRKKSYSPCKKCCLFFLVVEAWTLFNTSLTLEKCFVMKLDSIAWAATVVTTALSDRLCVGQPSSSCLDRTSEKVGCSDTNISSGWASLAHSESTQSPSLVHRGSMKSHLDSDVGNFEIVSSFCAWLNIFWERWEFFSQFLSSVSTSPSP